MSHATRPIAADPEYRALRALAGIEHQSDSEQPVETLERIAILARNLTNARYGALVITDGSDNVEGFVTSGLTPEDERRLKAAPQGHGPLGTMRKDGLAVRIDNLADHEKAFGFPPKHPAMTTLLGLPLQVGSDVRGALYATDKDGGRPFDEDDEVTLSILARHAAHVIQTRWY
jgi:GAF domain-containing protein